MTRRVHFDPFGMRLQGYQQGINDEVQLQDTTRRARQADYQHNVTQPLELNAMRRADTLGQHILPYQMNAADRSEQMGAYTQPFAMNAARRADEMGTFEVPFLQGRLRNEAATAQGNIYDAENQRLIEYGLRTGDWGRVMGHDTGRYAPTENVAPSTTAVDSPANKAYDDWTGLMQQEGLDITDPISQRYREQLEQAYGMQPGELMNPQAQMQDQNYETTPGYQVYVDPITGQRTQYSLDPRSYQQYGFYPRALQMQQERRAAQNTAIQQGWQDLKNNPAAGEQADTPFYLGE